MTNIKQWEYERLAKLCANHPKQMLSITHIGGADLRRSAWLRIIGLMETWDMIAR